MDGVSGSDAMTLRLVRDVSAGIRVLRRRDGVALSDGQIVERARNIVMALINNYRIEPLAEDSPRPAARSRRRDAAVRFEKH